MPKPGPEPRASPLVSYERARRFLLESRPNVVASHTSEADLLFRTAERHTRARTTATLQDSAVSILQGANDEPTKERPLDGLNVSLDAVIHRVSLLAAHGLSDLMMPPTDRPGSLGDYERLTAFRKMLCEWRNTFEKARVAHAGYTNLRGESGIEMLDAKDERAFAAALLSRAGKLGIAPPSSMETAALSVLCGLERPVRCKACFRRWNDIVDAMSRQPRPNEFEAQLTALVCEHEAEVQVETKRRTEVWRKHLKRLANHPTDNGAR